MPFWKNEKLAGFWNRDTLMLVDTMLKDKPFPNVAFGFAILFFTSIALVAERGISVGWLPLLFLSLIFVFKQKKANKLDRFDAWFLCALLLIPLSVLVNQLVHNDDDWSKIDNSLRFVLMIPVFLALRSYTPSSFFLLIGLSVGGLVAAAIALYDVLVLGQQFSHGNFYKIQFGAFSLTFCFLGIICLLCLDITSNYLKAFLVLGVMSAFTACILALSRGPWMAVPLFLLIVIFIGLHKGFKVHHIGTLIVASVLVFAGIAVSNKNVSSKLTEAYKHTKAYFNDSNNEVKGSAGTRLEMWKAAIIIHKQKPYFGVGLENYKQHKNQLIKQEKINQSVEIYAHPHSEYFSILAEQGLIGLLSYLLAFLYFIYYFLRAYGKNLFASFAGLSLVGSFMIFGLTEPYLRYQSATVFFLVFLVILAAYKSVGLPDDEVVLE